MEQTVAKPFNGRSGKRKLLSLPESIVEENDDDAEVLEIQESEEQSESVASDSGMSKEQLLDHYAVCMRMAAENKITTKNAFSLKLIDLLKHVIKSEDSDGINFSTAGSAIDASTKIYSCRVENLYSQVTRLASGLYHSQDKPPCPSPTKCRSHKVPPNKKHRIIASKSQLQRVPHKRSLALESVGGTCLMEVYPLIRPSEGVVLHHNRPFWPDQSITPDRVVDEMVTIRPHKYVSKHRPQRYLTGTNRANCLTVKMSTSEPVDMKVNISGTASSRVSDDGDLSVQLLCAKSRDYEETTVPVERLLLSEPVQSDYHYLDTRWFTMLDTPSFWHYPRRYIDSNSGESEVMSVLTLEKRTPVTIIYENRRVDVKLFNKKWRISNSYKAQRWKEEALLLVDEFRWQKEIKRLFCCNFVMKDPKVPEHSHLSLSDDDTLEQDSSVISSSTPKHHIADVDMLADSGIVDQSVSISSPASVQNCMEDSGVADKCLSPPPYKTVCIPGEDETCSETSMLVGDNLVPAPKQMVLPKIHYALKPKNIDMKKLKETFWLEIQREHFEKEDIVAEGRSVMFTHLLRSVKTKMAAEESEALSWQLAIACILHVASERLLDLKQTDTTDFSIHYSGESTL